MITAIIEKLKTGKIKNVVAYGAKKLPEPPYIVVRPESDSRGRLIRIFVHFAAGQNIFLEDYVFNDLSVLLDEFTAKSRHGNYNKLLSENNYTDIIINNDDGTISMERCFLLPSRIF